MSSYSQGAIVWASYPLTEKLDKLKKRPVLIISNEQSNVLDNDYIVIPITKAIREEGFSMTVLPEDVVGDLPIRSELRCNKPFTIRNLLLHEPIGLLDRNKLEKALALVQAAVAFGQP